MTTNRATTIILVGIAILEGSYTTAQNIPPQSRSIGIVDGRPLTPNVTREAAVARFRAKNLRPPSGPADEQQVASLFSRATCDYIEGQIHASAVTAQKRRFAISASAAEGEALRLQYWTLHDAQAEAKQSQDNSIAVVTALNQVYESGMDSQEAYKKFIEPHGLPQSLWQANLEEGRTREGRAKLARPATLTADSIKNTLGGAQAEVQLLEKQRLDEAVDQEIARRDATFRTYVDELHSKTIRPNPFESQTRGMATDHRAYIETKRAEWWQSHASEVNLVLFDPALADSCGLKAAAR
jgi:hypothetical protein